MSNSAGERLSASPSYDARAIEDRDRASRAMLATALHDTGHVSGSLDAVRDTLYLMDTYGPVWLKEPDDPRGTVLRSYIFHLAAMVEESDRSREVDS